MKKKMSTLSWLCFASRDRVQPVSQPIAWDDILWRPRVERTRACEHLSHALRRLFLIHHGRVRSLTTKKKSGSVYKDVVRVLCGTHHPPGQPSHGGSKCK